MSFRHALRHALLPVVTILGLGLGRLIAGAVIIEVVFAWPGIGRLIIDSIVQSDYPMVQTAIIVLAASIALANALVDVSYRLIDPRIRAGRSVMAARTADSLDLEFSSAAPTGALEALARTLHPARDCRGPSCSPARFADVSCAA